MEGSAPGPGDLVIDCVSAQQAQRATAALAALGVATERMALVQADGRGGEAPPAASAWDSRTFAGLFRRWITSGLAGALGSLAALLLAVGIARAAGAATASWAPSAMIVSVIAGFEIFGFGAAMLALPSLDEINAHAADAPQRVRVIVRVHDERERARLSAALARTAPSAPAGQTHAA